MAALAQWLLSHQVAAFSAPITVVSADSFANAVAPDSIAMAFGTGLAVQTQAAASQPLPTNLAGTTVKVNRQLAGLFFVSATQINFLIPAETAPGTGNLEVSINGNPVATGTAQVSVLAPAVFTASQNVYRSPHTASAVPVGLPLL